jgi:hypothetical protein
MSPTGTLTVPLVNALRQLTDLWPVTIHFPLTGLQVAEVMETSGQQT